MILLLSRLCSRSMAVAVVRNDRLVSKLHGGVALYSSSISGNEVRKATLSLPSFQPAPLWEKMMKIRNLIIASTLLLTLVAAIPGDAQRIPVSPSPQAATDNETAVRRTSPAVDLRIVGRQVAPGVIEVSPEALQGRRLI